MKSTCMCLTAVALGAILSTNACAMDASASYNFLTGDASISATDVVNVFIDAPSGILAPVDVADAPGGSGALVSSNPFRIGLTALSPFSVDDWGGKIGAGHSADDLRLVVGPSLGAPAVSHPAGSANFAYIPEPASAGLLGLGMLGLFAARRK